MPKHTWREIRPFAYQDGLGLERYRFELGLGMYYCLACKAKALTLGKGGPEPNGCPVKKTRKAT